MADKKKTEERTKDQTEEPKPCNICGKVHDEPETVDGEDLAKELLNLVSEYALKRGIAPTPDNFYIMGNALARVGTQLCFEAGEMKARVEPFLRLMQALRGAGQRAQEEELKKKMEQWPKA